MLIFPDTIALYTGVWIETIFTSYLTGCISIAPYTGRRLKHFFVWICTATNSKVYRSLPGARIETQLLVPLVMDGHHRSLLD
ncbi:hypothetical protein [Brevibacillus laterosporus]|uniref:Uncharacterized protein n=1 Tax=Brevibacillus laterosporus TaxID=1465 RepID=A0AAP3GEA6_BRELA|nr:hypothetical protein [Brevibacillus laterosporus]MCR8983383.1 hypothetical protein [Brevibacillus laterosporus]MCZ0810539.1 hypothetical protein [Brevibacillus laterosporus]MCZ0823925.1 hypothetical protein [Brevibacillus laterosporus]MCZ0853322.1 hypothetical protein [Brevibacillus laterosporus]